MVLRPSYGAGIGVIAGLTYVWLTLVWIVSAFRTHGPFTAVRTCVRHTASCDGST